MHCGRKKKMNRLIFAIVIIALFSGFKIAGAQTYDELRQQTLQQKQEQQDNYQQSIQAEQNAQPETKPQILNPQTGLPYTAGTGGNQDNQAQENQTTTQQQDQQQPTQPQQQPANPWLAPNPYHGGPTNNPYPANVYPNQPPPQQQNQQQQQQQKEQQQQQNQGINIYAPGVSGGANPPKPEPRPSNIYQ